MWTNFQNSFITGFMRKFSVYTHKDIHLICNMLLHYLVTVENPKMLLILYIFIHHINGSTTTIKKKKIIIANLVKLN